MNTELWIAIGIVTVITWGLIIWQIIRTVQPAAGARKNPRGRENAVEEPGPLARRKDK